MTAAPPATGAVAALIPAGGPLRLAPLAGDASNRRYFRVTQDGTTYVLMQMADPEGFKASEEAVTGAVPLDEPPFLNLQRYLKAGGAPVPEVVAVDLEAGLILLEDLGDVSLMAAIDGRPEAEVAALYGRAVDHLVRLQRDTPLDAGCVAAHRAFGADLLAWELDHYLEYGVEARHGTVIPPATRAALEKEANALAGEIAAAPRVLVHRDYHSRNLMVREGGALGLIDFQDALLGPVTYDLASLLWDPYVTLPAGLAERLAARYAAATPVALPDDFEHLLARTALQRLLKAAGRFVYIDRVKGNPAFLPDIPACLSRARAILAADAGLAPLRDLLAEVEPELAAG